ncbi:hypothetical protein V2I01_06190 [Micromonospora sp. BRA006-A]|nr:hypothetical protein [Micromonospora sp. BRA006-A]
MLAVAGRVQVDLAGDLRPDGGVLLRLGADREQLDGVPRLHHVGLGDDLALVVPARVGHSRGEREKAGSAEGGARDHLPEHLLSHDQRLHPCSS